MISKHWELTRDCRHSYGTYLYQKTKDLRRVQDQLVHSSPILTQVYSHITPEERVRSVNGSKV